MAFFCDAQLDTVVYFDFLFSIFSCVVSNNYSCWRTKNIDDHEIWRDKNLVDLMVWHEGEEGREREEERVEWMNRTLRGL